MQPYTRLRYGQLHFRRLSWDSEKPEYGGAKVTESLDFIINSGNSTPRYLGGGGVLPLAFVPLLGLGVLVLPGTRITREE